MLTGDQNMIEMTAVVHYNIDRPDHYLFQQVDPEAVLRTASEAALRSVVNTIPLDSLLTTGRRAAEKLAAEGLNDLLAEYRAGVNVLKIHIQDMHPSVEVVDAFREVAGALEEKNRMINEAEGYANEQVALARGQSEALVQQAKGYRASRSDRAGGDAARFTQMESAYRAAPASTSTRLYLETMEEILPGRRKLVIDSAGGRRTLWTMDEGVLVSPREPRCSSLPRLSKCRNWANKPCTTTVTRTIITTIGHTHDHSHPHEHHATIRTIMSTGTNRSTGTASCIATAAGF